jgi:nitroimidazol reductase NimA-like FMN-containing flavoprotein (pyridoxamine 5'-phosphate oxidase superfamily)
MEAIIKACRTCWLGVCDAGIPYVVPMNFALDGDSVILHSGKDGRLPETLRRNPTVCINWTLGDTVTWQDKLVGCSYRVQSKSVIVEGILQEVTDFDEKERLLHVIMAQYSPHSFTFAVPSVNNVAVYRVPIATISARDFGVRPPYPASAPSPLAIKKGGTL